MSWINRRSQPSPAPASATAPGVPLYNPNQHSQPPQWPQQNYPTGPTPPPTQQYPPQSNQYGGTTNWYNQSQSDNYQQINQNLPAPPAQQNWQSPPTQQGFSTVPLNQTPRYSPHNQHQQQQQYQPPAPGYQNQNYIQHDHFYQQQQPNPPPQPHRATPNSLQNSQVDPWNWGWGEEANNGNNGNNNVVNNRAIEDSFTNQDDTWNWRIDDSNSSSSASNSIQADVKPDVNLIKQAVVQQNVTNNLTNIPQIPSDNETPIVFEQMGALANKHQNVSNPHLAKLKNQSFLKQESTDSAISQESTSDDLQTSEEKQLSRSSTISQCPSIPQQEYFGENSVEHHFDQNLQFKQETVSDEIDNWNDGNDNTIQSQIAEVRHAIENLALQQNFENKEIVTPETSQVRKPLPPPPKNMTPPLNQENSNPYKRNNSKSNYVAIGNTQEVNLETVPDNVERPDLGTPDLGRSQNRKRGPQMVENLEVAPKNDRNQYLETGQLSESYLPDYNNDGLFEANTEEPPPGLRRMVLGHTENEAVNPDTEEPRILTGLDRVIDGEPENAPSTIPTTPFQQNDTNDELPAGLHRMVPGESSSPESNTRWNPTPQNNFYRPASSYHDDAEEAELQNIEGSLPPRPTQRSETIGADTPPTQNDSNPEMLREANLDGDDSVPTNDPNDTTIRSQTDGENTMDTNKDVPRSVRPQRTDSSEDDVREVSNDRRRTKSPGRFEDRKYYRGDSPDRYWDRKDRRRRDRFYEDDTDYYSDKERNNNRRGPREPKSREEFDRSYSSLRRGGDRENHRDYDRNYSSLRRDYDRDKPRTAERERGNGGGPRSEYDRDERGRRDDYYYGRYEDDYYGRESRSSRPSSRSDSNYRERVDPRKVRDPYNSYYQGYGYDPATAAPNTAYYAAHYQQHYQYYENLRRTNPAAYAEWYRKYMQSISSSHSLNQTQSAAGDSQAYRAHEDKASVHSGRSSANEELHKQRYASHRYYTGPQDVQHMSGYYSHPHTNHSYSQDDSRLLDNTDSSLHLDDPSMSSHRLTPAKFSTAHIKADISSGHFVQVLPHYPIDGQPPIVEILDMRKLLADDPEQQELNEYPGPLIKGVTHKKTLIEYCETKIKRAMNGPIFNDRDSYILMWELLILLLRQNGVVVGTDIAELLIKNASSTPVTSSRRPSAVSSVNSLHEEPSQLDLTDDTSIQNISQPLNPSKSQNFNETYVTNKFREYLIYGSGKEALEWAMKHGLWGHALFLASKLDKRTYANVMMRFANGLTINDPLQTLYQLLSGRLPAAVTCVSDDKWGDWRPHLAMILSNTSHRPELDRKAITTLGDTLQSRGSLYAAHFCFLMAQTGFGTYDSTSSRLVLLGSSHQKSFIEFASNEAIIMTEVYEYACSLSDSTFNIPEFQTYKYLLATRLAERGFLERALLYTERVGIAITQNPTRHSPSFAGQIVALAERLRPRDTLADIQIENDNEDSDGENNNSNPTIEWISNLKSILSDYDMGILTQDAQSLSNLASSELDITQSVTPPTDVVQQGQQTYDQSWNQQTQPHVEQTPPQFYPTDFSQQPQVPQQQQQQPLWNEQQQWSNNEQPKVEYQTTQQQPTGEFNEYQDQQNQYWNQQQWSGDSNINQDDYWNSAQKEPEPTKAPMKKAKEAPQPPPIAQKITPPPKKELDAAPRPQITMPNSTKYDEEPSLSNNSIPSKPIAPVQKKDSKQSASSSGWFGGIWNKLSLRPKNQMILPDDKNPTIVWDSEKKRWVNLDGTEGEVSAEMRPPPKMAEMFAPPPAPMPQMNHIENQPQSLPTFGQTVPGFEPPSGENIDPSKKPPVVPNMFKMQRGRTLKKAYVDVFNPTGTKGPSSLPPATNVLGASAISNTPQMNFFVPGPMDANAPVNFLTPTGAVGAPNGGDNDNSQINGPGMYDTSQYSQGLTMGSQYSH